MKRAEDEKIDSGIYSSSSLSSSLFYIKDIYNIYILYINCIYLCSCKCQTRNGYHDDLGEIETNQHIF